MNKVNSVIELGRKDYKFLKAALSEIKKQIGGEIQEIDVRLCIDFDNETPSWVVRSGLSDYDQTHSELCGASSINRHSKIVNVLEDLLTQVTDQAAYQCAN
jgi:hypothetical protein